MAWDSCATPWRLHLVVHVKWLNDTKNATAKGDWPNLAVAITASLLAAYRCTLLATQYREAPFKIAYWVFCMCRSHLPGAEYGVLDMSGSGGGNACVMLSGSSHHN